MLNTLLVFFFSIVGTYVLYTSIIDFNRDVPHEYLNQQSLVESTRKPNELAIHKSTKLDYSQGTRVGLGIRYDLYKIRNGNLNDIWQLFIKATQTEKSTITVGGEPITVPQLNYAVHDLLDLMKSWLDVSELAVPLEIFMADKYTLAVVVAAFLRQIPVHVYEDKSKHLIDENAVLVTEGFELRRNGSSSTLYQFSSLDFSSEKKDFVNDYTVEKDRGIALKVSSRLNHKVIASTAFTQLNLVSAVASCIKHLPASKQLGTKDTMVIVQDRTTAESILNEVVKLLVVFVSGSKLVLTTPEAEYMAYKPTVLVLSTRETKKLEHMPTGLSKLIHHHRLFALSRLKFTSNEASKLYPGLRLVYVHRDCSKGQYRNWNEFRASLGVQVVEEVGHFNVAGPFLVSDLYDYRVLPSKAMETVAAAGGIVQCNEIKILNFEATNSGDLAVRGFNIGKSVTIMDGVGQTKVLPDEDGFYKLPFIARWGLDGCLYVFMRNK